MSEASNVTQDDGNTTQVDLDHVTIGTGSGGGGIILFTIIGLVLYFTFPKWSCCKPKRPWKDLNKKDLELLRLETEVYQKKMEKENQERETKLMDDIEKGVDGAKIPWTAANSIEKTDNAMGNDPSVALQSNESGKGENVGNSNEMYKSTLRQKAADRISTGLPQNRKLSANLDPRSRQHASIQEHYISTDSLDDFQSCYDSVSRISFGSRMSSPLWKRYNGETRPGYPSSESLDFQDAMESISIDSDNYSFASAHVT